MNSTNTIRKAVQIVSAIALIIGASGCATQAAGGSKLDHDEVAREIANNRNTIQVCGQYGSKRSCEKVDRDTAIADLEHLWNTTGDDLEW